MKKLTALLLACALLLSLAGCCCIPTKDKKDKEEDATTTTTTTEVAIKEPASLTALKKDIAEAGKLFGVAYLGGFEGDAASAKQNLFAQEYLRDLSFVKDITSYAEMDGMLTYCVVPVDETVTLSICEYVFADMPYKGDEICSVNEPILLRGNVSDIVPNLCIVATKGEEQVEYCPQQSGMDGRLVNSENLVYDFTPYAYMAEFGGVDRVPDVVFSGDWCAVAKDGNGQERTLYLTLNTDGTVQYVYGIGNSEILEEFEGTWVLEDDILKCTMTGGAINPNGASTSRRQCNPCFEWNITADGLILKHVSGTPLLSGTKGKTFTFVAAMG